MPTAFQKKQKSRSKNKKGDTRTYKEIFKTLPDIDVEPLMRKYMGHDNAFHKGSISQKFIDVEMEPIDKELLDKIKLFIDDSQLYLERKPKKNPNKMSAMTKVIIEERCRLVFVYANMYCIYNRQQAIDKILARFDGDEMMGKVIKEMACREAFSN